MKICSFESSVIIPADIKTCWSFFSSPANLSKITPTSLDFRITSKPETMFYAGQIICYKVRPMLGLSVNWVTEISQVKEYEFFIDEQRSGPYAFWHHNHFFKTVPEGVEMRDLVHYALPLGFLGRAASRMVRKKIEEIFTYRSSVIASFFGK